MYKKYSKKELKSMPNGIYLLIADPNMETDYWPPNDEEITLVDGEITTKEGIRLEISGADYQLKLIKST